MSEVQKTGRGKSSEGIRESMNESVDGSWESPRVSSREVTTTELSPEVISRAMSAARSLGIKEVVVPPEYRRSQIEAGGDRVAANYSDLDGLAIHRMAEVMAEGSEKFGPPSEVWVHIDSVNHINHALAHLFKYLSGDTSEDHLAHAACRTMGALGKKLRDEKEGQ
jgi:endonuclease IV